MKPVPQTDFGVTTGNCFTACVASILELPIHEVPDFCCDHEDDDWEETFREWLEQRGLYPIIVDFENEGAEVPSWEIHWILGGRSRAGHKHAVVWYGDEIAHNPITGHTGIAQPLRGYVVIPMDLGEWIRENGTG